MTIRTISRIFDGPNRTLRNDPASVTRTGCPRPLLRACRLGRSAPDPEHRAPSNGGRNAEDKEIHGRTGRLCDLDTHGRRYSRRRSTAAPVGSGFTVTASDLAYILKQIKIAESHAATYTAANPCGTLVATPGDGIPDANQIPDRLTAYGLRTVDGSCNNLFAGREKFAAADVAVPAADRPGVPGRRAHHVGLPGRRSRTDALQAEERLGRRLATAAGQQPDRRPDLDQPGRHRRRRCSRCAPRATRGRSRARPIPTRQLFPRSSACRRTACRRTRPCTSPTSPPTSGCPRRTTRGSPSSVSSSTTASTRRSRAAAPCSSRCRRTTR